MEIPCIEVAPHRPVALLADLHANLEALHVCLQWLREHHVEQVLVLGDVIGYGASPKEVADLIHHRGYPVLRGNHEDLLDVEKLEAQGNLKLRARRALEWTREQLEPVFQTWLRGLPLALRVGDHAIAVHGSLVDPRHCYAYTYDLSLDLNIRRLRELAAPPGTLVFYGHTHRPQVFQVVEEVWKEKRLDAGTLTLDTQAWYFINPGSVGYPRDGDPRASLMIWHPQLRQVEHVRLPYDVEAAAARIRAAGYDEEMPQRLLTAR